RAAIEEGARVGAKAAAGDLAARADSRRFEGAFRELLDGTNGILDAVIMPLNEAATALEAIAARDLSTRVTGAYRGDHAKIKDSINRAATNLEEALSEVTPAASQ